MAAHRQMYAALNPTTLSRQHTYSDHQLPLEQWAGYNSGLDVRLAGLGEYSLPPNSVRHPASVSEFSTSGKSISSNGFLSNQSTGTSYFPPAQPAAMPGVVPVGRATPSTPSLTQSCSTISSSSARTGSAPPLAQQDLLEEQNGILQHPEPLECLLANIINCHRRFADEGVWGAHMTGHLRGVNPPPRVRCPYPACGIIYSDGDGNRGWEALMDHVASIHAGGPSIRNVPVDRDFLEFLWRKKLIKTSVYQQKRISIPGQMLWTEPNGRGERRHEARPL